MEGDWERDWLLDRSVLMMIVGYRGRGRWRWRGCTVTEVSLFPVFVSILYLLSTVTKVFIYYSLYAWYYARE